MAHHHHQAYGYGDFSSGSGHSGSSSGMPCYETSSGHGMSELQAGMEMLGMPSKHFFLKPDGTSSWQQQQQQQQQSRAFVDDPSSSRFHAAEHPISNAQRLSLSLLRRDQTLMQPDARFYQTYQLKNSIYLIPAQELLNEFCNLGAVNSSPRRRQRQRQTDPSSSSKSASPSWSHSALLSMDILELQTHKARLLSMLEEVDRRYSRYCEQMQAVVASFEAVAGRGSARVYSTLASKTISQHFRCVRDGIVGQIRATKKAMGEKDPVAVGTSKGETPRLKLLDQCLRQQKAFQQGGGAMESQPWRPQRGLPERSVSILRAWLFEHFLHPYPSDVDKHILARQTGLSRSQVSNWFINARVRLWKPMVEEMYLEEAKDQASSQSSKETTAAAECESNDNNSRANNQQQTSQNPNPNPSLLLLADQKPQIPSPHLPIDSDSLASIFNSGSGRHNPNGPRAENFDVVDLDFASYNNQCGGSGSGSNGQNFGSGVSLTLGLQQHTCGAMSLSFSPASHQPSMFYSREQMEDCQPVPFSILDGDQGQNLPYRDLMGAQLLHDFGRLN